MKENGRMVEPMVRDNSGMLMETSTKAIGKMTKLMALVFTSMLMEQSTLVNGKMTCSMEVDKRRGQMAPSMKENIGKVVSMDRVSTPG